MALNTTIGDVWAAVDMIDALAYDADAFDSDTVVAYVAALDGLKTAIGVARSLLETRAITTMTEPKRLNDRLYLIKDRTVRRDDHAAIAAEVVDYALVDRVTGEVISDPAEAVHRAVMVMGSIYVSPSTTAKKTALQTLGPQVVDNVVVENKIEGRKLEIIQLKGT